MTITETQAGTYATDLFRSYGAEPIILDVRQSDEPDCIDVELHAGDEYGFVAVTCWLEAGQPYGEW